MRFETYWYLKYLRFFQQLDAEAFHTFRRMSRVRTYTYHEPISTSTDTARFVYLVGRGRIKLARTLPKQETSGDQNQQNQDETIAVLEAGEMFGETGKATPESTVRAEAMDELSVYVIRRESWIDFLKAHPLTQRIDYWRGWQRKRLEVPLQKLVFRSVSARFAGLLLEFAEQGRHEAASITLSVVLPNKQWARLLGAPEGTVQKILDAFQQERFIRRQGRRLHILSLWGLKKWSRRPAREIEPAPPVDSEMDIYQGGGTLQPIGGMPQLFSGDTAGRSEGNATQSRTNV